MSSPTKKTPLHLHNIEIPPRKLLGRKIHNRQMGETYETFLDSPKPSSPDETLFRKFLPHNTGYDDDGNDDPYSSDHFRMFEFKVRRCTRSRSHDWTDCPFAHPGEKARRRDPRKYCYSGTVCPDFRRGGCSRGDSCEFAHGVFECWLHPNRYRTEACKDGKNCKRKVCFFAHTPRQLRLLPVSNSPEASPGLKFKKSSASNNCCVYCHHSLTSSSPTSTLMGISHLSPPLSPPISPVKRHSLNAFSSVSRFSDQVNSGILSYEDALDELRSSFEVMNFTDGSSPPSGGNSFSWIDDSFSGDDHNQQFILSPSAPTKHSSGSSTDFFGRACSSQSLITSNSNASFSTHHDKLNENNNGWATPDFGWVNELLM